MFLNLYQLEMARKKQIKKIEMNRAKVNSWRDGVKDDLNEVKTDLSVVKNDVKWIKDNLSTIGVRQDKMSRQIGYLRGWGSIVGVVLGSLIAVIGSMVLSLK